MIVVFHLVGGPWDGQALSTDADDEANACFAQALWAMTAGRRGACIPLISPSGKELIDRGVREKQRQAIRPHQYRIERTERRDGQWTIVARHVASERR